MHPAEAERSRSRRITVNLDTDSKVVADITIDNPPPGYSGKVVVRPPQVGDLYLNNDGRIFKARKDWMDGAPRVVLVRSTPQHPYTFGYFAWTDWSRTWYWFPCKPMFKCHKKATDASWWDPIGEDSVGTKVLNVHIEALGLNDKLQDIEQLHRRLMKLKDDELKILTDYEVEIVYQ